MIRIAVTLLGCGSLSYVVLPAIRSLEYYQSTTIFFCMILIVIGIHIRGNARHNAAMAVMQASKQAKAPTPIDPTMAESLTGELAAVLQAAGLVQQPPAVAPAVAVQAVKSKPTVSKAQGFYEIEVMTINRLLKTHYKLNAEVTIQGMVKAPRFIAYEVVQKGPLTFDKLKKIEYDLAREVNAINRNNAFGPVTCMFSSTQPHWLQVTNPKPYRIHWDQRYDLWKPQPFDAYLGFYYDGSTAKPLVANIKGKNSPFINGGWFGQPGAGKSTDMHMALTSLLEYTSPSELHVYGIDIAKNVWQRYQGVPHLKRYARDIEEALRILKQFSDWCQADGLKIDGIHRLLVIDECQDLLTHPDHGKIALKYLSDILSKGREFGIRVWMATQNPDSDCYPSKLKPKTHFMACGFIMNDDYVSSELGIVGASVMTEKEEFIYMGPGTNTREKGAGTRVTMYEFTDQDLESSIETVIRKWGYGEINNAGPEKELIFNPATTIAQPVAQSAVAVTVVDTKMVQPVAPSPRSKLGAEHRWMLDHRMLTPDEADRLIEIVQAEDPKSEKFHYRGGVSENRVIEWVYEGGKNVEKSAWIKEVLVKGGLIQAEKASKSKRSGQK
jgi:hypothetical protein